MIVIAAYASLGRNVPPPSVVRDVCYRYTYSPDLLSSGCKVILSTMTTVVKKKARIVVPEVLRRRAGIVPGDTLEMKAIGGVITIIANPAPDGEEYTAEQRRIVNAQLAEGLEDIRKGRVSRRFDTVDEMLASLKSGRKTARRPKTRTR